MHVSAKCVKVYDGDTATFAFSPHSSLPPQCFSCRFYGYNSAELKSKDKAEVAKAIKSRDYLANLILNKIVSLRLGAFDKYGRVLIDAYLPNGLHVNKEMLRLGHGMPYTGVGPKDY